MSVNKVILLGNVGRDPAVSYTHLRAHETGRNLVCRLLLEKKKKKIEKEDKYIDKNKKSMSI